MQREKDLLKQWKADLQAVQEEKRLKKKAKKKKAKKKKAKKKNKKYSIPGNTADFMNGKNTYHKENGVWKQRNK
ncbi:hypothetical protein [Bacillus wiedmannii]|uniref:hypothetical protein n=1 Tax=Bacillus wiedmannii TaxID=1890302 RepID=UPI003D97CF3A